MLAKNPTQVAQFKEGKQQVLGFLVGQVMKASGGKANPGKVNELLKKKLGEASEDLIGVRQAAQNGSQRGAQVRENRRRTLRGARCDE